jgi:hypothetical protein
MRDKDLQRPEEIPSSDFIRSLLAGNTIDRSPSPPLRD